MSTRTTHRPTDGLALFLIGMRFSKPWRVDAWLPAFLAMPRMLRELSTDPDSGMLGVRLLRGERGVTVVQYWRDTASIYAYANDGDKQHRPAWTAFYRAARRVPGAVGIWHETYAVSAAETLYVDMPPTGLAAALGPEPITPRNRTAHARLHGENVADAAPAAEPDDQNLD